jgi:hypothetical protein
MIQAAMNVAVRGQGKTGGAIHWSLNFLLTFSFKRKSKKHLLQQEKQIVIWSFERVAI